MKRFFGILLSLLLLAAMAIGMSLVSSAEEAGAASNNIIFIAKNAKGTGDGSSPENAMGNEAYTVTEDTKANDYWDKQALVRAFEELGKRALAAAEGTWTGGTVVIVDEVVIDSSNRNDNTTPYELNLPRYSKYTPAIGTITVTSVYGGVDYRTQGAKITIDRSQFFSVGYIYLRCPTVWENLNIDYIGTPSPEEPEAWPTNPFIGTYGSDITMGEGLNITAPGEGYYPILLAGDRYQRRTQENTITVKSGKFAQIIGTSFDVDKTGATTVNIEGGEIGAVYSGNNFGGKTNAILKADFTVNISGGKIGTVNCTNKNGITGNATVSVTGGTVGSVYASCADATEETVPPVVSSITYSSAFVTGEVVGFTNVNKTDGTPGENPPETKPAETKPAETKPGETKPAETKPGATETKPVQTGTALYVLMGTAAAALAGAVIAIAGKRKAVR